MGAVFVRKAFENAATRPGDENPAKHVRFVDVDKFAHCTFNRLLYDRKISGSFAASSFLGLPKYYTLQRSLRRINPNTFCRKIALLLFLEGANKEFSDQLVPLD